MIRIGHMKLRGRLSSKDGKTVWHVYDDGGRAYIIRTTPDRPTVAWHPRNRTAKQWLANQHTPPNWTLARL